MPIRYLTSGNPLNGTPASEFILGYEPTTGTSANTIYASTGSDIVLGDGTLAFVVPSTEANNSISTAFDIDDPAKWTQDENSLFRDSSIPHASLLVENTWGEAEYFSIDLDAGETITIDIDYSTDGLHDSDLTVGVLNSAGTQLAFNDIGGWLDGVPEYEYGDPFLAYTVPSAGSYYIRVRPAGETVFSNVGMVFMLNVTASGHAVTTPSPTGDDVIEGDPIDATTGGRDVLLGTGGDDTISGGPGDDTIDGGSGSDVLNGGPGQDNMYDGLGLSPGADGAFDIVHGDDGSDHLYSSGAGSFYGDNGRDVIVAGPVGFGIQYLDGGSDVDLLDLTARNSGTFSIDLATGATSTGEQFVNFEYIKTGGTADNITGSGVENVIQSEGGDDVLRGLGGTDVMFAGAGNDLLDGGTGRDFMIGGSGDDQYILDSPDDAVRESPGEGIDTVYTPYTINLAYLFAENVILSGNSAVDAVGNGASNMITGNGAANLLNGGAGADILRGQGGNDLFYVDNAGDRVIEAAGEGSDRIFAAADFTLESGSYVELLSTTSNSATANIDLTGNEFANLLYGNAGANRLSGGGGNDRLVGYGGVDELIGGPGDDWLFVDSAVDKVVEGANEGNDRLFSDVSYTLAAGSEVETISIAYRDGIAPFNLAGNEFANTLFGNSGDNILNGGGGADILSGFAGDDSYYVDDAADRIYEAGGGGSDRIFASVTYIQRDGVHAEILSTTDNGGTAAIDLVGNALANTIFGNAGANVLNGKGGADILSGLAGDDRYWVDDAGDQVFEAIGGGADRVFASTSFALGAGAEIELLSTDENSGTAPIDLTGNEFANRIYGNAADNILDGGGGNDRLSGHGGLDTLIGGTGNDLFFVDANDIVVEALGEGSDRIFAIESYALGAGVEVETLSTVANAGTAPIDLTGNELANILYGNNGGNLLDGGAGADAMQGLGGADRFAFTTALGGGNVDLVADFVAGTDLIALDDAVFAGLAPGALDPAAFTTGTAATDADDRIVYDSATGALYFDADGAGGAAAVQFATLQFAPALGAGDVVVI